MLQRLPSGQGGSPSDRFLHQIPSTVCALPVRCLFKTFQCLFRFLERNLYEAVTLSFQVFSYLAQRAVQRNPHFGKSTKLRCSGFCRSYLIDTMAMAAVVVLALSEYLSDVRKRTFGDFLTCRGASGHLLRCAGG